VTGAHDKAFDIKGFAEAFGEAFDTTGFVAAFGSAFDAGGACKYFVSGLKDGADLPISRALSPVWKYGGGASGALAIVVAMWMIAYAAGLTQIAGCISQVLTDSCAGGSGS
jgi:hypothetical protein